MNRFFVLLALLLGFSCSFGQNIRWELSAQGFSSFNSFAQNYQGKAPQIQHAGVRIGAAFNKFSDLQLAIRQQSRTDYGQSSLLTATRSRRAARYCDDRTLAHSSSGLEIETLFRIRNAQFSRIHAFWGAGLAWSLSSDMHGYDPEIELVEIPRRNGGTRTIECGFQEGQFEGAQFAMIFAPGVRVRITHKIHAELETQFRYLPLTTSGGLGGVGLNLVYNFY